MRALQCVLLLTAVLVGGRHVNRDQAQAYQVDSSRELGAEGVGSMSPELKRADNAAVARFVLDPTSGDAPGTQEQSEVQVNGPGLKPHALRRASNELDAESRDLKKKNAGTTTAQVQPEANPSKAGASCFGMDPNGYGNIWG
ncbi:hypothetical protein CF327_g5024 [Tilletia walkeri]|uniref:Uncharacterized protein n=1 Tax=Tilletia walkeri TaxID=117179 RepID=A0A8X7NAW8_9BASI|nr:hypothetical protein CF327_g5024 [Tilletia walkeri]KAE8268675.1 hypothetical protein A4X09_0g3666 [Tilletia walkeri]